MANTHPYRYTQPYYDGHSTCECGYYSDDCDCCYSDGYDSDEYEIVPRRGLTSRPRQGTLHRVAEEEDIELTHRPGGCHDGGRCEEYQHQIFSRGRRDMGLRAQGLSNREIFRILFDGPAGPRRGGMDREEGELRVHRRRATGDMPDGGCVGPAQSGLIDAAAQAGVPRFAPAESEGSAALRAQPDALDRGNRNTLERLRSYQMMGRRRFAPAEFEGPAALRPQPDALNRGNWNALQRLGSYQMMAIQMMGRRHAAGGWNTFAGSMGERGPRMEEAELNEDEEPGNRGMGGSRGGINRGGRGMRGGRGGRGSGAARGGMGSMGGDIGDMDGMDGPSSGIGGRGGRGDPGRRGSRGGMAGSSAGTGGRGRGGASMRPEVEDDEGH
ncbi:MAG: hypothetical protein Q9223_007406 [Gallowayella weberi]